MQRPELMGLRKQILRFGTDPQPEASRRFFLGCGFGTGCPVRSAIRQPFGGGQLTPQAAKVARVKPPFADLPA